jgi:hypothetical protein
MAAFTPGDALPIPQEHDADERFAQDEYQHQKTPVHRGEPRSPNFHDLWFNLVSGIGSRSPTYLLTTRNSTMIGVGFAATL